MSQDSMRRGQSTVDGHRVASHRETSCWIHRLGERARLDPRHPASFRESWLEGCGAHGGAMFNGPRELL
jgi:hypothetical protein